MTTKLPPETYLQVWQKAAEQEIGLEITCPPEDQPKLVAALYQCRDTFGGFDDLMLFQPLPAGTIFIAKKATELPE